MNCFLKIFCFIVAMISGGDFAAVDYTGKEFLIPFRGRGSLYIRLSAEYNANVTIRNNANGTRKSYSVVGGKSVSTELYYDGTDRLTSNTTYLITSTTRRPIFQTEWTDDRTGGSNKLSLYIVSSSPINVYVINKRPHSSDGYHVIPLKALSTKYMVVSYTSGGIMASAVHNDTTIKIQFRISISGTVVSPQNQINVSLNRFEVIRILYRYDLTGTVISSNKPIAVVSGGDRTFEEMLPPTEAFGKTFVLHHLATEDTTTVYRVVAKTKGTNIHGSNGLNMTIDGGDYVDIPVTDPLCITTSRPVLVVLFGLFENIPILLSIVPSTDQYSGKTYYTDFFSSLVYYIMIVTSKKNRSGLNGLGDNIEVVDVDSCDYAVATLTRTSNNLIINVGETASLGIILYGFAKTNIDSVATGFGFHLGIEFEMHGCMSNPCHNDAICLDSFYNYSCNCSGKFTGRFCETPLIVDPSPTTTFDHNFDSTSTVKSPGKDSGDHRPPSITSLMPSTPQTESVNVMLQTRITDLAHQLEVSPIQDPTEWNTPPLNSEGGSLASLSVVPSLRSEFPSPWTSTTTLPGSSTTRVCRCSCRGQGAQTKESASQYAEQTRKSLTVEKATLRKTINKRVTVKDGRPSAYALGWIAILMALVPAAFFVIPDVFSRCIHIRELYVGIENN